jgi:hypothetical protein
MNHSQVLSIHSPKCHIANLVQQPQRTGWTIGPPSLLCIQRHHKLIIHRPEGLTLRLCDIPGIDKNLHLKAQLPVLPPNRPKALYMNQSQDLSIHVHKCHITKLILLPHGIGRTIGLP